MRTNLAYSTNRALRVAALAMLAGVGAACDIYIDEPPVCIQPVPAPPLLLLDPVTGECVPFDLGEYCDPETCVCSAPPIAFPSWAPCDSACTGFEERACIAAAGCRATYRPDGYHGCFATDQTGPIQGSCEGLDAWDCSRHDDCIANHDGGYAYIATDPVSPLPPLQPLGRFISCEDEPEVCFADDECAPGQRCNVEEVCNYAVDCPDTGICGPACFGLCVPDWRGTCFGEVSCPALPPQCVPGSTPGVANGCFTGACIPFEECARVPFEECHGEASCDALPPECLEGQVPQLRNGCWTGNCIPLEMCEQQPSPGACFGVFTCDVPPPDCGQGFVPGVSGGCFDGTCVELGKCGAWPPSLVCTSDVLCEREPPFCPQGYQPLIDGTCYTDICVPAVMCEQPPECTDIGDEQECLSAPGCTPVYTGEDCTCAPEGCTCESWKFDRCR